MNRRTIHISALVVLSALATITSACGGDDSPSSTEAPVAPEDSTQIANPASVFCIEQGGTLEIVDGETGQVGYCTLPDGTRVEEWEYFRSFNSSSELPGDDGEDVPDTTG